MLHDLDLTSLTLIFDLADVSKKAQLFHWRARFCPCSLPTTRSSSRSHLFPTKIMGTWLIKRNESSQFKNIRMVFRHQWAQQVLFFLSLNCTNCKSKWEVVKRRTSYWRINFMSFKHIEKSIWQLLQQHGNVFSVLKARGHRLLLKLESYLAQPNKNKNTTPTSGTGYRLYDKFDVLIKTSTSEPTAMIKLTCAR